MAIPSLSQIPAMTGYAMQLGNNPTPLDAIRERRNERMKIESESKYKEAMAEKALWEIEATRKEMEREEQFRQLSQQYERDRRAALPQQPPSLPQMGGTPPSSPTMGMSGGVQPQPSAPYQGGMDTIGTPYTDRATYFESMGFPDKAAAELSKGATYQSNKGQALKRQQEEHRRRGEAAYAALLAGKDMSKITEKYPQFQTPDDIYAAVPKERLVELRNQIQEQNMRTRPATPPKPEDISSQIKTQEDLTGYFSQIAVERLGIPSIEDEDGNTVVDFDEIDQTSYIAAEKDYAQAVQRLQNMTKAEQAKYMQPGETPVTAAARMTADSYFVANYDPFGPGDFTFLMPQADWMIMHELYPNIEEKEAYRRYLVKIGVLTDKAQALKTPAGTP